MKPGNPSHRITLHTRKIQQKSLINLRTVTKAPRCYGVTEKKPICNLKQQEDETVEQLDIRLMNTLLKFDYQHDQMDTRKVEVMFNATRYKIKSNAT